MVDFYLLGNVKEVCRILMVFCFVIKKFFVMLFFVMLVIFVLGWYVGRCIV